MLIGSLQVELLIPDSVSLKSKRMALNSIKKRLQNKFNISVAEVDNNDLWQRATLGIAMVSNQRRFLDQAMNRVLDFIDEQDLIQVIDYQLEIL